MIRFILFIIIICILFSVFGRQSIDLIGSVIELLTKLLHFLISVIPETANVRTTSQYDTMFGLNAFY